MLRAPRALALLALCVTLAAISCHRDRKQQQLASLERGYAAGVLTQSEYEAKKAWVLGGPPPAATAPLAKQSAPAPETPPPPPVETPPPADTPPPPPPKPTPTKTAEPEPEPPPQTPPPPEEPAPLAGCSEAAAKPGKEKGKQERFFLVPLARVKAAASSALESLDFKINDDSGDEIEATKKRHFGVIGSGGEKVNLHFEPSRQNGRQGTLVVGETKKGLLGRVGQKSWTNAVLAQTGCLLERGR